MSLRKFVAMIVVAVGLALSTSVALAQGQPKADDSSAAPDVAAMMKKMEEVGTPGESHKKLDPLVGKWTMKTRAWVHGPGKPPAESIGTTDTKWSLDGRFILQEADGEMMGKPFRGIGYTGYDNFKEKYVFFWIDSSATAMYTGEGTLDAASKVFTFYGKMDEPVTGEKDKTIKYVTRVVSNDLHVFEIYDLVGTPNEFKIVEITYTRKPGGKSKR